MKTTFTPWPQTKGKLSKVIEWQRATELRGIFFQLQQQQNVPVTKRECHSPSLTSPDSSGMLGPIRVQSEESWMPPGKLMSYSSCPHSSSQCHGKSFPLLLSLHSRFPFGYKNVRHSRLGLGELKAGVLSVTWGENPSKAEFTLCLATTRCQQLIWFQFPKQRKGRRTHEEGKEGLGLRWLFVCQVGLQGSCLLGKMLTAQAGPMSEDENTTRTHSWDRILGLTL